VSRAVHAVAGLQNQSPAVWRYIYTSLQALFERLKENDAHLIDDSTLARDMHKIVQETSIEIEAIRRLQEELRTAIASSEPNLLRQMQSSADQPS
jgi:polysaccharide deacetylase 2 family uncharacterized protein YibQ